MNTTFVTAFMNIYNKPVMGRDLEWRFNHFEKIANTNINICLFISNSYYEVFKDKLNNLENVKVYISEFENSWIYDIINKYKDKINLPNNRNIEKDTKEYILLMNQKIEYVKRIIDLNPWNSDYFAWIDFNINHVFRNSENTCKYLNNFSKIQLSGEFLFVPGCWNKHSHKNILLDNIHWRFCGGYFIGDKSSVLKFNELYEKYFPEFIENHFKLIWEVNFWTWLENEKSMHFDWYSSGHDDTIIQIPLKIN